jgi:hypothetical protein
MGMAQHQASTVAYYGSEEAIMAGLHLIWFDHIVINHFYDEYYDDFENVVEHRAFLQTPDGNRIYVNLNESDYESWELRALYEERAIKEQLQHFRAAKENLENTQGLMYYISTESPPIPEGRAEITRMTRVFHGDGFNVIVETEKVDEEHQADKAQLSYIIHSNVPESRQNADFFRTQPVHYLMTGNDRAEQSYRTNFPTHRYDIGGQFLSGGELFVAFNHGTVNAQNIIYASAQDAYLLDLGIIAASAVLILTFTFVLLAGAGRKRIAADGDTDGAGSVHFTIIDKIYFDIGLAALICWIAWWLSTCKHRMASREYNCYARPSRGGGAAARPACIVVAFEFRKTRESRAVLEAHADICGSSRLLLQIPALLRKNGPIAVGQ